MAMVCYQEGPGGASNDWTRTDMWSQYPPAGLPLIDPSGDGGASQCIEAIKLEWTGSLLVEGVDYHGLAIVGDVAYVLYESTIMSLSSIKQDALMAPIIARAPA